MPFFTSRTSERISGNVHKIKDLKGAFSNAIETAKEKKKSLRFHMLAKHAYENEVACSSGQGNGGQKRACNVPVLSLYWEERKQKGSNRSGKCLVLLEENATCR